MNTFPLQSLKDKIPGVSRTSLKDLQALVTTCEQCPAGCGITAYLDEDRLVQILGNPHHPISQGSVCAKGISGLNLVNDPERLLYPFKRLGARGEGKWAQISWDEVYSLISHRIKSLVKESRIEELVIDIGQSDPILSQFIDTIGSTTRINRPNLKNMSRDLALKSMLGFAFVREDVGRSRTILNFGANPYANHDRYVYLAKQMVQARVERGARLITFDVRLSETAAKSDEWYPIRSGTDGMVALAMAKVIVDRNLVNEDFFSARTNISLSQLKQHLSPYTLEEAEKETGISKAVIAELAVDIATKAPSVAIFGGGISDHDNGVQSARCVALLNWLIGNLEQEGGILVPEQSPSTLASEFDFGPGPSGIADMIEANRKVDTYFAYMANPAYSDPDCLASAQLLKDEKSVPFLVVMDTHLTETALCADLILPAATYLESWGLIKDLTQDGESLLSLKRPVVSKLSPAQALRSPDFDSGKLLEPVFQPKGESKEIGQLCLELSRRLKGDIQKELPFQSTEDFVRQALSDLPDFEFPKDFEILKSQGQCIAQTKAAAPYWEREIEIFSPSFEAAGFAPMPEYNKPSSQSDEEAGEFILTTFKSNLEAKGSANSKWSREILHHNPLWMNKAAASKLGLQNGDKIRVVSSVGTLITSVLTTGRIHPESVALAEGLGHTAIGKVAQAVRFRSSDLDTELIWWVKQGNGVNPHEIIERRRQKIGRGLALKSTKVKIEKL